MREGAWISRVTCVPYTDLSMLDPQTRDGVSAPDVHGAAVAPDVKLPTEPAPETDVDMPVGLAYVPGLSDRLSNLMESIRRLVTAGHARQPM